MLPLIHEYLAEIATVCREFDVRRLEVFGSAARVADFDPNSSDVDFIVEFGTETLPPTLERFLALRSALELVLGCRVDLSSAMPVRNPFLRTEINRSREAVYAA